MKFHLSPFDGNLITGTGPGWVRVGQQTYETSLIIAPDAIVSPWIASFEALDDMAIEAIRALAPEMVLLGTGVRQRFPHPRTYRALIDRGVGVEVMDTSAAARTYNIIAAEGRRVVAGLVMA